MSDPSAQPLDHECRSCKQVRPSTKWRNCKFERVVMKRHALEYICDPCEKKHSDEIFPIAPVARAS